MGTKIPSNIVVSVIGNKIAKLKASDPNVSVEDALELIVEEKKEYADYNWTDKKVKADLEKRVTDRLNTANITPAAAQAAKAAPAAAPAATTPKKNVAPERMVLRGKANVDFNEDGSFRITGGKELLLGCPEGSEPILRPVKGKKKTFEGACESKD